eukprot:6190778-Pleurochrysis_carterae.AAC.1
MFFCWKHDTVGANEKECGSISVREGSEGATVENGLRKEESKSGKEKSGRKSQKKGKNRKESG